jgi:hypothetical protein
MISHSNTERFATHAGASIIVRGVRNSSLFHFSLLDNGSYRQIQQLDATEFITTIVEGNCPGVSN